MTIAYAAQAIPTTTASGNTAARPKSISKGVGTNKVGEVCTGILYSGVMPSRLQRALAPKQKRKFSLNPES